MNGLQCVQICLTNFVMYRLYNNNFQCSVLQFRKVFCTNYITQGCKQVVFCLKFYLTLTEKKRFVFDGELCVVQLSDI